MATLTETVEYPVGIYQLEVTDPVQGGADGVDNLPLRQLANRTAYLKSNHDALETEFDALHIDHDLLHSEFNTLVTRHDALSDNFDAAHAEHHALRTEFNTLHTEFDAHLSEAGPGLANHIADTGDPHAAAGYLKHSDLTNHLPIATVSSLGVIKVGNGLSITSDGVLSLTGYAEQNRMLLSGVAIFPADDMSTAPDANVSKTFTGDGWVATRVSSEYIYIQFTDTSLFKVPPVVCVKPLSYDEDARVDDANLITPYIAPGGTSVHGCLLGLDWAESRSILTAVNSSFMFHAVALPPDGTAQTGGVIAGRVSVHTNSIVPATVTVSITGNGWTASITSCTLYPIGSSQHVAPGTTIFSGGTVTYTTPFSGGASVFLNPFKSIRHETTGSSTIIARCTITSSNTNGFTFAVTQKIGTSAFETGWMHDGFSFIAIEHS